MSEIKSQSTTLINKQQVNSKIFLIIFVQYFITILLYLIKPVAFGVSYFNAFIFLRPITDLSLYLTGSYDFQLFVGFYLVNLFFWIVWPILFVLIINIIIKVFTSKYIHQFFDEKK